MCSYTAFEGFKKIANADLEKVLIKIKKRLIAHPEAQILIFSDFTGKQMDFDLSGTNSEIIERHKMYTAKMPVSKTSVGRPKLGVVAREISLLPSHWEWLNAQPGGASATIRVLIDEKNKVATSQKEKTKTAQEVTYKFLNGIAGDLPNFEEAIRFLYRSDEQKFAELISEWPKDIASHALFLAAPVFEKK